MSDGSGGRGGGTNARRHFQHSAEIIASGYAYPSLRIDNGEYLRRCEFHITDDPEGLAASTRMKTRAWCAPHENPWTLARDAVDSILERHPGLRQEIDVVIVTSGTTMPLAHPPEPDNPGMGDIAPLVIRHLGRTDILGMDIKACYCTGFVRGLQVMDSLLADPNLRAGLVIAAEHGSRLSTAPTNRSSFSFIAADAAGAVVLRRGERREGAGLLDHYGRTEADKFYWVGVGDDAVSNVMRGSRAGEATRRMLLDCARTLLDRNGLSVDDVDWLLPIQTHAGVVESLRASLGWPEERLLWRGDITGFSGSASIPAALAEALEAGRVKRGDLVLSVAVGAGMNCGGTLYHA